MRERERDKSRRGQAGEIGKRNKNERVGGRDRKT
jgi:hypothetical protein